MSDSLDQFYEEKPVTLPAFLKVLCILTFVGSGLGILGALGGFAMGGMNERLMQDMNNIGGGIYDQMGLDIDAMIVWTKYSNIANLLGSALCLTGALMMWKLKKVGYYLYVPGVVIPAVVSVFAMRHILPSGPFAGLGTASIVVGFIFSAAFIVMYGVNYKHLR